MSPRYYSLFLVSEKKNTYRSMSTHSSRWQMQWNSVFIQRWCPCPSPFDRCHMRFILWMKHKLHRYNSLKFDKFKPTFYACVCLYLGMFCFFRSIPAKRVTNQENRSPQIYDMYQATVFTSVSAYSIIPYHCITYTNTCNFWATEPKDIYGKVNWVLAALLNGIGCCFVFLLFLFFYHTLLKITTILHVMLPPKTSTLQT